MGATENFCSKQIFVTEESAMMAVKAIQIAGRGQQAEISRCPVCRHFHINWIVLAKKRRTRVA